MGTWGVGPYDSDTALEFCADLEEGLRSLEQEMDLFAEADTFEDSDYAVEALTAAAMIAHKVDPGYEVYEPMATWVKENVVATPKLVRQALKIVSVATAADSELAELWRESDGYEDWISDCQKLRDVLQSGAH